MTHPENPMDMKPLALIATLALSFSAHAAGGHHHGTGSVEAAIDGGQIRIALELPLESAVGFERAPKTDKEKAALADAAKLLNDANAVFVPTPAAQCTVESSQVSIPHTDGAAADKDGHADVDATYVFRCANPAALKGVETTEIWRYFSSRKTCKRDQQHTIQKKMKSNTNWRDFLAGSLPWLRERAKHNRAKSG